MNNFDNRKECNLANNFRNCRSESIFSCIRLSAFTIFSCLSIGGNNSLKFFMSA